MIATKAKPTERDLRQVAEDITAERRALADAQREAEELRRRRGEMLASATVDQVQAIDAEIDRAGIAVDLATARLGPLMAELEKLRAAVRDAMLERNLKAALALAEKGREALDRYGEHAAAIVGIFRELAEIRGELDMLNERLPPDAARVEIEPPRWGGATLASTAVLPGVGEDANYWPVRSRRLALNEIYANR